MGQPSPIATSSMVEWKLIAFRRASETMDRLEDYAMKERSRGQRNAIRSNLQDLWDSLLVIYSREDQLAPDRLVRLYVPNDPVYDAKVLTLELYEVSFIRGPLHLLDIDEYMDKVHALNILPRPFPTHVVPGVGQRIDEETYWLDYSKGEDDAQYI